MFRRSIRLGLLASLMPLSFLVMLAVWFGHEALLEQFSRDVRQDMLAQESDQLQNLLTNSYPDTVRAIKSIESLEFVFQHAFAFRIGQTQYFSAGVDKEIMSPLLSEKTPGVVYIKSGQRSLIGYRRTFRTNRLPVVLVVAETQTPHLAGWERVHVSIAILSVLLLIVLWCVIFLAVHLALSPVSRVRNDLADLHSGRRARLHNTVPQEFSGLVNGFNRLLETLDDRLERSRRTIANLSHSVKTPLASVLAVLEADSSHISPDDRIYMIKQLRSLHKTLDSQMRRGDVSGPQISRSTQVVVLTEDLVDLVGRMFPQKQFRFSPKPGVPLKWQVDEQDFSEVAGNLLENAGKWSLSVVDLALSKSTEGLNLSISDDGPGIQEEDRERLLERWVRLDEQGSGYGLGLSIVKEIVDRYEGRLEFSESSLGGLQVNVLFPGQAVEECQNARRFP